MSSWSAAISPAEPPPPSLREAFARHAGLVIDGTATEREMQYAPPVRRLPFADIGGMPLFAFLALVVVFAGLVVSLNPS